MIRARRFALELLQLVVISCAAGALIAALVALAVGAIVPEQWSAAFLQAFPIFAALVFASALLIELLSRVDVGNPPPLPDRDEPPSRVKL